MLHRSLESAEEWFFLREYLDKNKQYNIMKDSINIPQQVLFKLHGCETLIEILNF